jgi:RNA polymerase sigma-54 factor
MKHSLQLKLSQHLTLTPQLQQSIRLLQLSTLDLNQELERFLMENPLLERIDGWSDTGTGAAAEGTAEGDGSAAEGSGTAPAAEAPAQEAPEPSWDEGESWGSEEFSSSGGRDDADDSDYPQQQAATPSLVQHLTSQLNLTQLSARDKQVVTLLVAHLDEDGYLTQSLEEIAAPLPEELDIGLEELQVGLKQLHNLDPPGIGARNLSECLALQLEGLPAQIGARADALRIVKQHLDLLAARDYNRLKKALGLTDETLRAARQLIRALNPKPGAVFNQTETRYVMPDVLVKKVRGKWSVTLNQEAMPKLRINKMYADILQRSRDGSAQHLAGQLQEARWLIKNVQQRFETILRVSQAIVDRQKHFFDHGEVAMRPLVLREIADTVGLHESTVSRVTTQKFMLTPRGIFELKYFFGSHVATETGGAASSTAIRALIKQLVGAEDATKPLSDGRIAEVLAQQGIVVARRTVAKYREALQIQPANQRKGL